MSTTCGGGMNQLGLGVEKKIKDLAVKEYWQQDGWLAAEDSVANVEESVATVCKKAMFANHIPSPCVV